MDAWKLNVGRQKNFDGIEDQDSVAKFLNVQFEFNDRFDGFQKKQANYICFYFDISMFLQI